MQFTKDTCVDTLLEWLTKGNIEGLTPRGQILLKEMIDMYFGHTAMPVFTPSSKGLEATLAMYYALFPPRLAGQVLPKSTFMEVAKFLAETIERLNQQKWLRR